MLCQQGFHLRAPRPIAVAMCGPPRLAINRSRLLEDGTNRRVDLCARKRRRIADARQRADDRFAGPGVRKRSTPLAAVTPDDLTPHAPLVLADAGKTLLHVDARGRQRGGLGVR